MDTNDLIKLLEERIRQFADALDQHRDGSLANAKLDQLFQEVLALQGKLFCDAEQDEDQ